MSKTYRSFAKNSAALSLLLSLALACGGVKIGDDGSAGSGGAGEGEVGGAGDVGPDDVGSDNAAGSGGDSGNDADAGCDAGNSGTPLLGLANDYVMLAKTGISTAAPSLVTGAVGSFPASSRFISGFGLAAGSNDTFATSPQVKGKVYAGDQVAPTPSALAAAVADMQQAFAGMATRTPDVVDLGAGEIGGLTLEPGVYKWAGAVQISADVTLRGDAAAVWIFQIAQDLNIADQTQVVLAGAASAVNVFWQVAGAVNLGTTSQGVGNILAYKSITLRKGAAVEGRLLSQAGIELDGNSVHDLAHLEPLASAK